MNLATVFARTKPNDKAKIVMVFQHMDKKVSMCGDGANDCGALKQADIGLSLSQAEASISAPFTSQVANISSMVELIKECRSGLATNFSLFNIMAVYSLIEYTTTVISEKFLQYPGDLQYLYWDLCLNFFFILFIGYTKTAKTLSVDRPRSSLFGVTNLFQMLLAFGIQVAGQISFIAIFQAVNSDYYWTNGGMDNAITTYNDAGAFGSGL
jgi:magnesium-transporting ATPase (P-type)